MGVEGPLKAKDEKVSTPDEASKTITWPLDMCNKRKPLISLESQWRGPVFLCPWYPIAEKQKNMHTHTYTHRGGVG